MSAEPPGFMLDTIVFSPVLDGVRRYRKDGRRFLVPNVQVRLARCHSQCQDPLLALRGTCLPLSTTGARPS